MLNMLKQGLWFFAITMIASAAHAAPADSNVCEGALPIAQLIRVEVVKGGYRYADCPRGARSPYLCALHRAGFAGRSLGYAMRNILADLGDGTCERVNLRGVLIHTADGRELHGDKFVNPRKSLPVSGLRFGAWRTGVLYLAPEGGGEQLAKCTQERSACETELAQADKCGQNDQLYDPGTGECRPCPTPPVVECPERSECPECPTAARCPACPTCTVKIEDARACIAARDALQQQVANLKPRADRGDKAKACGDRAQLFDDNAGFCVPSDSAADAATKRLETLNTLVMDVRLCHGRSPRHRFRFTDESSGVCEYVSPP